MKTSIILASALLTTERYLRERGNTILRAIPFRRDGEDFYKLMYI